MPLNKLDNFIKNTDGRTLYVNPNDLDATDSITNTGNSLAQPFKTIQRALLEAARFSFVSGSDNDLVEKTTILVWPGEHLIDNRPGFAIYDNGGTAYAVPPTGGVGTPALSTLSLELDSNFDLTQEDNILYKFNSVNGGIIVPRGTSIVGLDLRKTKVRPKYVPNPTDPLVGKSAIFRVTGACYFWQFSFFDADESGLVYTHPSFFTSGYQSTPRFSHHKLTCFEYADGVNEVGTYGLTDLDMYYSKLSNAFNSYRPIPADAKFPASDEDFAKRNPEWEIVGAFATDPIDIQTVISGNGTTASTLVTVTTTEDHNLNAGTPIKIRGVSVSNYNISTKVQNVLSATQFTYLLETFPVTLDPTPVVTGATVTVETDTVSGASPYIFNCSLRSVWGMNGMHADGSKASGFRSMVVAQFTAVSLQKDDRAFVKYDPISRSYNGVNYSTVYGGDLPTGASQTDTTKVYHLDPDAIYRQGWESSHIKISNDSFIQVVSVFAIGFNKHFDIESGGDASITNSNSNFGQISLNSDGFKASAFDKDNNAFITSIVAPRDIDTTTEEDIEWLSIDVGLTTSVGVSTHLYLYGLNAVDSLPISVTQGYRIGARDSDKLYLSINNIEYSANIYMQDGVTSGYKVFDVSSVSSSTLTLGTHTLQTGEKIIINSETGDLPENVTPHIVYYAIRVNSTQIKLATSFTNALNNEALTIYGGEQLKVYSRVSDKSSGDIGSPIQFDTVEGNWYITVNSGNDIYSQINTLGVAGLSETTDLTYVKRIVDDRSLDEKVYKLRVVIPKELTGAKDPEDGFILQESSTTGARAGDFTRTSIASTDFEYDKNPRFIATCTLASTTVTVLTSLPHGLNVGDLVVIRNVTDANNPSGLYDRGYNGKFDVASIVDDMSFTHSVIDVNGRVHTPGASSTNDINSRTTADQVRDLPRFERNDWKSNLYVYRNEVISPYVEGAQDGIYHLYVLNANNTITEEFTNLEYSQSPVDLYPQLDRDNINANPPSAKTFALRAPIGDTNTSDLKKSITRESIDKLSTTLRVGQTIQTVSASTSSASLTFDRRHGLGSIATGAITAGASYTDGTFYDVKLLNTDADPSVGTWKGATAKVVVTGGAVTSVDIISSGSGYNDGEALYFDNTRIGAGNGNARYTLATSGISTNIGDVVQVTGIGTTSDGYYRISAVNSETQISVAKTAGDPTPIAGQYVFVVGPSSRITSRPYNSTTKLTTFTTATPHGLLKGNKFRVINSSNNNLGDYVVEERVGVTSFTAITSKSLSATNGYILKHGFSANDAISDIREENFGIRQIPLYDNEITSLSTAITDDAAATTLVISSINSGIGTAARFSLGSYIQIDNEIMRITTSNNNTQFDVIRGALGTRKEAHDAGSLIRKINPIAVEFRRPSILRASGHTFEYLGYGPGNYSTGLPQVQVKSLTEREDFLVQSQERAGGIVVYTGMNNSGDFFTGNTKTSSSSGEVTSYDIPRPTVTGEDPSKSSVVYDEVTVKERLLVEGGDSGTVLSQFDGPVTFNKQIRSKDTSTFSGQVRVTNATTSDSVGKGALTVKGGVGIGENLNVGGDSTYTGSVLVSNTTDSTSTSTGALKVLGGVGVAKTVTSLGLTVTGNASIGSTLTVSGAEGITSPKFKATVPQSSTLNGTPTFKMLRADGNQDFITFREVQNALGYVPADSATITGDFPLGNSLICDSIESQFDGSTTNFTLRIGGTAFVPAGSSANLIVSIGGVIQKPGADFLIVTSGGANTSTIRFTTAPASGVSCFIVALGGQGSLISNIDWDAKGQILVATGDNTAARLTVGSNGNVLTADSAAATGVKWAPGIPVGSFFYMAASSADTATGGSVTIGVTAYHAPEGYLICNGADIPTSGTFQGVNASLLQNLRSFLGSTYGATGRLPNLINNFAGYSAVPGATGGAATVTLTTNQMPSHNHSASTGGAGAHSHTFYNPARAFALAGGGASSGFDKPAYNFDTNNKSSTDAVGDHAHSVSIGSAGGGQAHENLPPYVGMLPVIKY
jgi:microcystin-dependent protein